MKFCKYLNISSECNFSPTLLYILYELSIKWLLGYNLILKINFQMNFSWLPTTWRSTFYGTLLENFIITCANLGVRPSFMDPNTSSIEEVWMEEDYKQKMSPLECQDLTGKLITHTQEKWCLCFVKMSLSPNLYSYFRDMNIFSISNKGWKYWLFFNF